MQNHIFGYARVSTQQQDLIRQFDLLKDFNCTEIITEKMSGTKKDRPELMRLKDKIRTGDTLIVESFSRLGRSTKDLIELVEYFEQKGVKLLSLKENFDTNTPQGKLMLTVFQAFSQFERDLIVQRTKEGIESSRARGRKGGRPRIKEKYIEKALNLYNSKEYSISEIVTMTGISQATLYRYIREKELNSTEKQSVEKEQVAKIRMWLRIENNNKFVRGKSKVRKEVEQYLRYDFNMEMNSSNEYVFFVPYKDMDDLTKQVEDIICEIANTADWRNCFIEADTYCDELDLYW
ncbi:recombinase family protein [Bacillus thuringiensis]|uniref:recombinase family protein n=1 Tax=Bacillus thuringiensis TaxID=1428 RepID=UPI000BFEA993|nr:recombinase family protein [Bacillus thuringiensis]PGK76510.1 DNA invertase [Bacillus thuringiensis]